MMAIILPKRSPAGRAALALLHAKADREAVVLQTPEPLAKSAGLLLDSPQGVVSPILANLYLDKLDKFVENVLIPQYTKGTKRKANKAYEKLMHRASYLARKGRKEEARRVKKQGQKLSSIDPQDPDYRRLRYCRLITRYQDADMVLRDERFVKERLKHGLLSGEQLHSSGPVGKLMNQILINLDPSDHTRLRQLLTLSFTPRLVEQWRGRIQEITDELIDAVEGQGTMDLIDQFAFPLPIKVISEMLGVPAEDSAQFRTWSNMIAEAIGDPLTLQQAGEQFQAFHTYLLALIEEKRQKPEDSLLSRLIQAETEGDRLSLGELVSMIFLLIIAEHETTVNLIGNGILALLEHPDQMALLKQNPALIKTAIEEFLRYRGSLMLATPRWANVDVLLGSKLIRRGDQVLVVLAAANRDGEALSSDSL